MSEKEQYPTGLCGGAEDDFHDSLHIGVIIFDCRISPDYNGQWQN